MGVWQSFPRWDSARTKRKTRLSGKRLGKAGILGKFPDRRVEALEGRLLLTSGPSLISIIPNDGSLLAPNDTIHTAPTQLTFRFLLNAGEALDPNTLGGIQLARSGSDGVFNNGNDIHITPGYVGIDPAHPNQVVMRFSSPLPDDLYRITIIGGSAGEVDPLTDTASPALPFNDGQDVAQDFRLAIGPQVLSIVPEPVTRGPSGQLVVQDKEIDVYFSGPVQTLPGNGNALDPGQFQLIDTKNTATTADDGTPINPVSVSYDPANNEATLTFSTSISTLGSGGAVRLRIGNTDETLPAPTAPTPYPGDPNGTFTGADPIGALGPQTQLFSGDLAQLTSLTNIVFPGGLSDPGHRNIPVDAGGENHATGSGGVTTITYSFPDVYGYDPTNGQPLHNQITDNQKQTVRYIFQLYSYYTGLTFEEVPGYSGDDWVAVGDTRVLAPNLPPTSIGGIATLGLGLAIINGNDDWGASLYGSGFMGTAMHEIGHTLGLPHDDDGPPGTIMNGGSESLTTTTGNPPPPLYPGLADITNLLYGYEPNSNQIDLYHFTADSTGTLNAQTVAQALPTQSTLDTLLTLYEEFNDLSLPASGAQVTLGDTFTITDNTGLMVKFEFTNDPSAINPATGKLFSDGNVGVLYSASSTQQDLAAAALDAVGKQGLNVSGTVGLSGVEFAGPITVGAAGSSISWSTSQKMIARNDNYYGHDSFLSLNLQPGIYYIAVTSTGNDQFDPNVADSGWGGKTFGDYQLKLDFQPTASQPLTDPGQSLFVPAGLASIPDGYSFTLSDVNASGTTVTETLKFYNGSTAPVSPPPGQISIQLQPSDTQDDVSNKIIVALNAAIASAGFDAANYTLSYLGNGRIEVGGGSATKIVVDPSGKGALTGTPLILWGDGQYDALVGNSNAGGAGAYNFWFNAGPTIYVDKTAPAGGDGLLTKPYNTIQAALQNSTVVGAAANGQEVNVRVEGNANASLGIAKTQSGTAQILPGETFNVSAGSFAGTFEFTSNLTYTPGQVLPDGNYAVLLPLSGTAAIASSVEGSLQATGLVSPDGGGVTVSDGGSDGNYQYVKLYQGQFPLSVLTQTTPFNARLTGVTVPSLYNNAPYLVGTDQFGNLLPDDSPGNSMLEIPKNVVLMIDAGAVFKLDKANIAAGSSVVNIDKSQSALQVLGVPGEQVTFTSYNDDTIGTPQIHPGIAVAPGDWGGLVFNPDSDLETLGIFLNNVAEAKLSYGGGQVVVNGVQQSFSPIYFDTARPTIANNLIVNSASAAMSGNPNAFESTRFGSDLAITATGTPSDGNTFNVGGTTFEFDSNGVVNQGNVAIPLAGLTTLPKLATAIEAAINNSLYAGSVDQAQALGAVVTLPQNLTVGTNTSPLTFTADSFAVDYQRFGPDVHGNMLSQTLGQTLTAAAGSALKSGTKFVINNTGFELISSGTPDPGYIGVNFTAASKAADVAQAIANAINSANIGVAAQWGAGQTAVQLTGAFKVQLPAPLAGTQKIIQNTINGLFIRINTNAGQSLDTLDVAAEFASTDIPYVLQENLVIHDDLGYVNFGGTTRQRVAGQLTIDPGVLVKLANSRIEAEMGSNLIAEGTAAQPIVFTSIDDWRYGGGGTFDTPSNGGSGGSILPQPGDWGGFYFWPTSSGSFDHTLITFGGGSTAIEGGFAPFDAVEIHQAKVRIADSTLEANAGSGGGDRNGREPSDAATIFVLGAQPVIVNNVIQNNAGAAISVDANSLDATLVPDWGRSTGAIARYSQFDDNYGPLVRLNKLGGNAINGMVVRGATLETSSIWDDTDIVHVLEGEVVVPNFASVGGLRLQSSATQSLVVKVAGASSGFTASGTPLDISDRIGGEVQVLGTPQHPVVLTSLNDTSVGAGLTPDDLPDNNTNGAAPNAKPAPGDWRGLLFDQYSNDRNVAMVDETEPALTGGKGTNDTTASPQSLGQLAPNEQSGDDNSRLGFQVNGFISPDYSQDVDNYTFKGTAGTQIWLNVTNTSPSLDAVLELVDANGKVLARSDNSGAEQQDATTAGDPLFAGPMLKGELPGNLAQPLQDSLFGTAGMNFWSTNPGDPGFRVVLPGSAGVHDYYVRIYSKGAGANAYVPGKGTSSGQYQLQIRLQNQVEIPGSTVEYADIRYATNGIDVEGLPSHSPLVSNSSSQSALHNSLSTAQNLGDLLGSDTSSINVGGDLANQYSVDWYKFELTYQEIQVITASAKTWAAVFDVGYADGLTRPDTIIDVYDSNGNLIYTGRDSNVADQQPRPNAGQDANQLNHSSFGTLDPYIGTVQMPAGQPGSGNYTYYVAIHSNATLPQALDATFNATSTNYLLRLEPVDSVNRIVEDHVGSQGGETAQDPSTLTPMWNGDTSSVKNIATLNSYATPYNLSDVVLFVNTGGPQGRLETVNPFTGAMETDQGQITSEVNGFNALAMRNDGELYGLTTGTNDGNSGNYVQIDTGTAAGSMKGDDGVVTEYINGTSVTAANKGVQYNAMAFVQATPQGTNKRFLYAIGSYLNGGSGSQPFLNGLYELDPDTGVVVPFNPNGINFAPQTAIPPTQPLDVPVTGVQAGETITGMTYLNGVMFIVGNEGNLYSLDYRSGQATRIANVSGLSFQSLTAGPPDVEPDPATGIGKYAGDLFAAAGGILYAFDTGGKLQNIFSADGGASYQSSIALGVTNVAGIAFSTLDYNLWHVTDRRGADPATTPADQGHGIVAAPDNSRAKNPNTNNPPQPGGTSFYFGLEDPKANNTQNLISVQPNASDYATNSSLYDTYNMPGGAYGSLSTNSFSLANYSSADKPTLYFNYFLNTEDAQSSKAKLQQMFDSARVLISEDGGVNWQPLATNNDYQPNYPDPEAERPNYQSVSSATGSGDPLQRVQPLFDSTTTNTGWRQARVDLSDFAGQNSLQLRFDFSTAGTTLNPGDLSINAVTGAANPYANQNVAGNQFGVFNGPQTTGAQRRGQDNSHEGWYIDDITVGLAERGEMITNPKPATSGSADTSFFNVPVNPVPGATQQVLSGPYQLEIRRGTEYGANFSDLFPWIDLNQSFDSNDRMSQSYSIVAPAGSGLTDGETFTLSDGVHSVTFEFDDTGSVATGNWPISFLPSYTAQQVADAIVAAVDSNPTLKGVSAADVNNQANGSQGVSIPATNIVNLFGVAEVSNVNTSQSTLRVVLAPSITESSTNKVGTLIRSGTNLPAMTVNLSAIDVETGNPSTNVTYPATVSFLPGQTLATFLYSGVVKGSPEWADGTQTVEFNASYAGFTSFGGTVDVTDDTGVLPTFTVTSLPSSIPENGTEYEGKVDVNTGPVDGSLHPGGLAVTLSSLWASAALVSGDLGGPFAAQATLTIPVGQTSASFWLIPQDDNVKNRLPNPFRDAQIVATAAGVISGSATLSVTDDTDGQIPYGVATWTAIGPAPIVGGYAGTGGDSGRIAGVAPDPTNPDVLYIAAAGGGVWKTTDATTASPSWTPLTDNITDANGNPVPLFMGAIAVAPNKPNVIYAGTGEANNSGDSFYGRGILVSQDGGKTWTLETAGGAFDRRSISKIAVDPSNANIAYAAVADFAENGLLGNTGIWKTTDGGVTWTNTTAGPLNDTIDSFSDVVVDPNNPTTVYAALGTFFGNFGSANNGIYKSTDGGTTWNLLSNFPNGVKDGRISLAISTANSGNVLYADVSGTGASGSTGFGSLFKIEKSIDGGATWTDLTAAASDFTGGQGWYDLTMAVDPSNSSIAYAAGSTNFGGVGIIRTTDGGATWTNITQDDNGNYAHTDWHAMAFDAIGKLLVGSDGGIWRKDPDPLNGAGFLWTNRNGDLNTIQFESIALDPAVATTVLGGSQDNGTELYTGNPVWTETDGGDGGEVRFNPQNPNVVYRVSPVGSFGPTAFFRKSTDGGSTWSSATTGLGSFANANFYPPFAVAPSDGNEVILGDNNLWITTNGATSWAPLTTIGTAGWNPNGNTVDAVAIAPSDANTIYASTGGEFASSSQIFISTNGGATWTEIDLPAGSGRVNQLAIDPKDSKIAYAVVNMFTGGGGHVFRTADGGATWTDISGNLPDEPTNAIAINGSTGALYVGNDTGVYVSNDLGASWAALGVGLPYAQVVDLEYNPNSNLLGAATHGRGAFLLPATTAGTTLTLSVNGAAQVSDDAGLLPGKLTVTRVDTTGSLVVSLTSSNPSAASVPATVTILNGQTSASVNVTITDDVLASNPQSALFTASVAGLSGAEPVGAVLDVLPDSQATEPNSPTDNDTPALSLSVPAETMVPGTSTQSLTATVTRNTPTTNALVVHLLSLNPSAATVQQTVTIQAGQSSATFTISGVDQFSASGGTLFGNIVAAADGFASASGFVSTQSPGAIVQYNPPVPSALGDVTMPRPQGEVILYGNQISNASQNGILVTASAPGTPFDTPPDSNNSLPHPGAAVNTPTLNSANLAPGVVIVNNLIYGVSSSGNGIAFEGDNAPNGATQGIVPFGRIANNTIYGGDNPTGTGILATNNSSPTILNNVLVNLASGRAIDVTGGSNAVLGENYYQNDGAAPVNVGTGSFDKVVTAATPSPFRKASTDPSKANFYLTDTALPIDASINSLQDRTSMTSVTGPLGIPPSPIIAPGFDLYGQLRVDDPAVTNANLGTGQNVFIDRGAIEHADTTGPTAALLAPIDNDQNDLNKSPNIVFVRGQSLSEFTIQLSDGLGSGIYDASVSPDRLDVREDGRLLTPGVDYYFDYDNNNHIIHLVAASGVWLNGHQYDIYLDNGVQFDPGNSAATPVGIADRAGNFLQANGPDGLTHFRLLLANVTNSAPVVQLVSSGTGTPSLSMYENSASPSYGTFSLTTPFSSADNTSVALSIFDVDANGGSETLTLSATHGTLTLSSAALTELNSIGVTPTGQGSNTITITAPLGEASAVAPTPGLNAALEGLVFTPDLNFDSHLGDQAVVTVTVNDNGNSPAPAQTAIYSIPIDVIAVNDPPVDAVPTSTAASPILLNEDTKQTFSKANGNAVTVVDSDITAADAGNALLPPFEEIITVNPSTLGTLTLTNVAGITFTGSTSNGQSKLDFLGTLSAINQALDGLVFNPAEELTGAVELTFTTNDHGNIGVGPAPQYLPSPQALTSTPEIVYLDVQPVVDAPTLNTGANLAFQPVVEDTPSASNTGSTVLAMLQSDLSVQPNAMTLNAPGAQYGIAVVAATETAHGLWQYKSPIGNWTPFPAVATDRALLIDAGDSVRFLPDPKFDDTRGAAPTLSFMAWDHTYDLFEGGPDVDGAVVDLTKTGTGGSTPFSLLSAGTATATLQVTPAPEAPTLASTASLSFQSINEDVLLANNNGSSVLSMLQSDPNYQPNAITLHATGTSRYGIAVTGLTQTANGVWQYQIGGGWANIPVSVSPTSALLLDGNDSVRFLPNPKFDNTRGGAPTLSFVAWDETFDYVNGIYDLDGSTVDLSLTGTGGSTPFSSGSAAVATLSVVPQPEAPTLNPAAALSFASILEDVAPVNNLGAAVLAMLQSDPNVQPNAITLNAVVSPQFGIAVVGLGQTAHGTWQYQLPAGNWTNFPSVSTTSALLLDGGDLVRFLPDQYFNDFYGGAPSLSFVAWDETFDYVNNRIDVHGQSVDLTATGTGGSAPFSSGPADAAQLSVKAVNDPPVVHGPTGPVALSPSSAFSLSTAPLPAFTITDPDLPEGNQQMQMTIDATENGVAGGAVGLTQLTGISIVSGANNSSSVTFKGAITDMLAALSNLVYEEDINFNGTASLILIANDLGNSGLGPQGQPAPFPLNSAPFNVTLTGVAIHRAPVLASGSPTLPDILENVPPANTPPAGVSISAMLATAGPNFLTVDTAAGGIPGIAIAGMSTGGGGVWQYSADGTTWTTIASAAPNQAVLLPASYQIRFWPNPGYAGNASITFYGWDQVTGTAGGTVDLTGPGATGGFNSFSTASGTATMNVKLINQPPLFTLAANDSVLENNTVTASGGSPGGSNAGPISLTDFATGISPGQPIESQPPFSQTVTFTVTTDRPDLFSVQPTLDPAAPGAATSTLHFALNPDVFGVAKISVVAHDNGGTANGGNDTSPLATTTLTVALINDPPSLNPIPNQSILENAGQQTRNLSGIASGLGESQNLTVTATSDNPAVVPNPSIAYTSPNDSGTLQYTPVPYASGIAHITVTVQDDGGTANGGIDTFTQTFTVGVQFVNQPPSFVKGSDQAVDEDSGLQVISNWATQIGPGPGNGETGQTLNFIVTPANPNIFAVPPSIDPLTGALRYQFSPNFSGSTNVSVELHDNGGTANGGHDTSATQTFKLTSLFVNDPPTFVAGPDQTVDENAPPQSVVGWATAVSPGVGFNEAGQTLNFQISTDNASLFAAGPSIDPATGTLTYTPALNAFGTATVTVLLHDNGGTANGGINTSLAQTFTINVNFVNHAPSFVGGPSLVVNENAPLQTIANWATQISAGPPSESGETLSFIVTNDNPLLFSMAPSIDPTTGTLTYQPAPFAAGAATVTVKLKDDGGTLNGGQDTSPAQTFKITVNFVNQAPTFTIGPNQFVDEDAPPQTVTNFITNISPGPGPKEVGQALNFIVTTDNNALFASLPTIDANTGTLRYALAPQTEGIANVTVQLHDNGGTVNGGHDTSAPPPQTFKITSQLVNHAPSFLFLGGDQYVNENTGAHLVASFVSQLSPGPAANEAGQTLNFQISTDNPSLFSAGPSIDPATGALSYTLAPNEYGTATVTIALHDDGGTANGGVDTSPTQTFKVYVYAPPVAQPDFLEISYAQTSSSTAAIGVLSNDSDPNGAPLTAVLVSGPAHGSFLLHADGSFNYTPGAGFEGLDQFTYMANDGHANSNVVTVRIMSHDASNVRKLYEQVLHRDPDDAGLQYWTNLIQNGSSLAVVAQGIFESDERLDPIITGYYQQFLLRTPDAAGLAFWRDQVWKAYGGPEEVIAGMLSSPEFFQSAGGTDLAWVKALYQRLLDRKPDPQGLQYWDNLLETHQATETQVVHGFLSSDEYYTNLIDGFFGEYLTRQPTLDELQSDLVQMRGGVSDRDIQLEIVVTDEYKNTPPPPPLGSMKQLTH